MKKNVFWGRTYSSREISEAKIRKGIIRLWQKGKRLSELIKGTGIEISVQAWWVARKKYEHHGFKGLLDRRGLNGGGTSNITNKEVELIKRKIDQDISLKQIQVIVQKEIRKTISLRAVTRLMKRIGIVRKRGGQQKVCGIDKAKGMPIDHAGVYFLKGAETDMTGVKAIIETIMTGREKDIKEKTALRRIGSMRSETIEKKVETLLYLPMFDMQKPYHLLKYHKKGLGVVTGSGKRYSYYTLEIFLGDIEKLRIAKEVGSELARCYVEALCIEIELEDGSYFYIDGHSKHVWSSKNIPKAFFTTLKRAERGLHQYFIHTSKGNPMILLTCPGDTRLPGVIFNLIDAFENAVGKRIMKAVVFDREGLSLSIFKELHERKKYFITLLREDMYKGEESFKMLKDYTPLKVEEREGEPIKVHSWVAEAEFKLRDKEKKRSLVVRTALVRKAVNERIKLIPIITNIKAKEEPDIRRIAKRYFERWPNQENMFRDAIEAFKVDTNHGYKKQEVPNRVVGRKKEELETNLRGITKRLNTASRESQKVESQLKNLEKIYHQRKALLHQERADLYAKIGFAEQANERQQLLKALRRIENKITQISEQCGQQITQLKVTFTNKKKHEKNLNTQKENKENEIKGLDLERVLYEIKTEKDHLMSNFKTLLINLSSYAQRQYFPEAFHSFNLESMKRTFYQQDGFVKVKKRRIDVTLHAYDDPKLQHAAEYACDKFNERDLKTLQGQQIWMQIEAA